MLGKMPDRMLEYVPNRMPDAVSEKLWKIWQIKCQEYILELECQNIGQIECQRHCQIVCLKILQIKGQVTK